MHVPLASWLIATTVSVAAAQGAPAASDPSPPTAPIATAEPAPVADRAPHADPADRASPLQVRPRAQLRSRGEMRLNPYESEARQGARDRADVGSRARVGLDAELGSLRMSLSAQDARRYGSVPPGGDDGSSLGLHEGFLEVGDDTTWLRLGRQHVALGDERMVGASDWSMAGRSFDAVRGHAGVDAWTLDVVGALVRMRRELSDEAGAQVDSGGDQFAAVYASLAAIEALSLDLYVLYRHDGATNGDLTRERHVVAPGARVDARPHRVLRITAELTYQAGSATVADGQAQPHRALAVTSDTTLALLAPELLSLGVGGSLATGASSSGWWSEFDNFYPTNHKFYGAADLVGLRNLREGHVQLTSRAQDGRLSGALALHVLGLATTAGRWADAGGRTLGATGTPGSALLGVELDAKLRAVPLDPLFVEGGYALFAPGEGARRFGYEAATQLLYLWVGAQLP